MHAAGWRLQDLVSNTKNYDVVGLIGTQRRAVVGKEKEAQQSSFGSKRFLIEAGRARAPLTNKAAGVGLYLGSAVKPSHVREVRVPPAAVQGRGLLVRL